MKRKKEALDDAINATKAAVAEGIVPGGGLALLRHYGSSRDVREYQDVRRGSCSSGTHWPLQRTSP